MKLRFVKQTTLEMSIQFFLIEKFTIYTHITISLYYSTTNYLGRQFCMVKGFAKHNIGFYLILAKHNWFLPNIGKT